MRAWENIKRPLNVTKRIWNCSLTGIPSEWKSDSFIHILGSMRRLWNTWKWCRVMTITMIMYQMFIFSREREKRPSPFYRMEFGRQKTMPCARTVTRPWQTFTWTMSAITKWRLSCSKRLFGRKTGKKSFMKSNGSWQSYISAWEIKKRQRFMPGSLWSILKNPDGPRRRTT